MSEASTVPNEEAVTALAVASADLVYRMNTFYGQELERFLESIVSEDEVEDRKSYLSYVRQVTSPLARDVMLLIWRHSKFVDEEVLRLTGFHVPTDDHKLTKNLISKLVIEAMGNVGPDKFNSVQIAVSRIAAALDYFGLIEYDNVRSNLKVLEGTECLHRFMLHVHTKIAGQLHAQFSSFDP